MKGQRRVLQDGVEAIALDGGGIKPDEGIGREHREGQEGGADGALHRQHARLQFKRQVAASQRHGGPENAEDQHPQQHRAFVIAPHAGNFVQQRFGRMRILEHVAQREIRRHIGMHEDEEGQRDERQLQERRRRRRCHQGAVATVCAVERHHELEQRHGKRQHQCEMPGFGDHCGAPLPSFTPLAFKLSATSLGM